MEESGRGFGRVTGLPRLCPIVPVGLVDELFRLELIDARMNKLIDQAVSKSQVLPLGLGANSLAAGGTGIGPMTGLQLIHEGENFDSPA